MACFMNAFAELWSIYKYLINIFKDVNTVQREIQCDCRGIMFFAWKSANKKGAAEAEWAVGMGLIQEKE